jgi:fructoselysine transporter
VPYAAAADGNFFPIFARLHPKKDFPYVSLLFVAGLGLCFSLMLRLGSAIDAILAMRVLVQFVAQAIGVVLLRRRNGTRNLPFRMWLYPAPVILSVAIWLFVWISTGWLAALLGLLLAGCGIAVFYGVRNSWKGSA